MPALGATDPTDLTAKAQVDHHNGPIFGLPSSFFHMVATVALATTAALA